MTITKLIDALRRIPGSGHPTTFKTPDGKLWMVDNIESVLKIHDEQPDALTTTINLMEWNLP